MIQPNTHNAASNPTSFTQTMSASCLGLCDDGSSDIQAPRAVVDRIMAIPLFDDRRPLRHERAALRRSTPLPVARTKKGRRSAGCPFTLAGSRLFLRGLVDRVGLVFTGVANRIGLVLQRVGLVVDRRLDLRARIVGRIVQRRRVGVDRVCKDCRLIQRRSRRPESSADRKRSARAGKRPPRGEIYCSSASSLFCGTYDLETRHRIRGSCAPNSRAQ